MSHKSFLVIYIMSIALYNSIEAMKRPRSEDNSLVKINSNEESSKKIKFSCNKSDCKFQTNNVSAIAYHERCHTNKCYQCIECHYLNEIRNKMEVHLSKRHHIDKNSLTFEKCTTLLLPHNNREKCHYCNLNVVNLKNHLQRAHNSMFFGHTRGRLKLSKKLSHSPTIISISSDDSSESEL